MSNAAVVKVRVHSIYGVQHFHDGLAYFHMAGKVHKDGLHDVPADKAEGFADLTDEQKAVYAEALKGVKSAEQIAFYARGGKKAPKPTVDEELDALEEAFKAPATETLTPIPPVKQVIEAGRIVKA